MATLLPQHHSMLHRSRTPSRMSRITLPDGQRQFLDRYAIEIFTDCVNAGQTFQAALSALYLSGLQNGIALTAAALPQGVEP